MNLYRIAIISFLVIPAVAAGTRWADASYSESDYGLGSSSWDREELAPGVELFQAHFEELFGVPQFVSVLRVNLDQEGVLVRFEAAGRFGWRAAPIPEFAEPSGAIAATNGGFGHGGPASTNSGIFKVDGEVQPFLKKEPEELRFVGGAALGIDEDNAWHFKNREGESWADDWPEVRHALAGGHRLIENGELHASLFTFESAREERHAGRRHPRTAVGLLPDRTAVLITVDGRHVDHAEGMTLEQLANFMKELGCVDALNLDGGGSTSMWVRGRGIVNHPSDNSRFDPEGARRVRSAVVVRADDHARE